MYISIYVYMYTYVYVYIYIYIYRGSRGRLRDGVVREVPALASFEASTMV